VVAQLTEGISHSGDSFQKKGQAVPTPEDRSRVQDRSRVEAAHTGCAARIFPSIAPLTIPRLLPKEEPPRKGDSACRPVHDTRPRRPFFTLSLLVPKSSHISRTLHSLSA